MVCLNPGCGKETKNPKFCSSSCAAVYNNNAHPKRKRLEPKLKACAECGRIAVKKGCVYCCSECREKHRKSNISKYDNKTLGDLQREISDQNKYVKIRTHARRVFELSGNEWKCSVCGYDLHVEICHIKAISTFDPETTLLIINSIENLVALCPNCHWELDHGFIAMDIT